MIMKSNLGRLILLSAAIIWGSSFVVMKNAVDFMSVGVLLFVRFILAALFLSLLFLKPLRNFPKDKVKYACICGVFLFLAYYIQSRGLALTTPGKNAFLTAIYVPLIPFLCWFVYKERPDHYNFIAAFMCIIGVGLVSLDSDLSMGLGDFLTLMSGIIYAVHIIMLKQFTEDVDAGAFTTIQFYISALCALIVSLLFEDITIIGNITSDIYLQIFYLAFLATGVGMLFQTIGEKLTDECSASLIMSLESVFGVICSIIFYNEVLTLQVLIGFIVIFIAIVISETKLSFIKKLPKLLMVLLLLVSSISFSDVKAESSWGLSAPYAYVIDITTNQVLYSKNGDDQIYPASLTKVMTALVCIENIDDLDEIVTIEEEDLEGLYEQGASVAYLVEGEKVTYGDLIYGVLLPSGADACQALGRLVFGGVDALVDAMNEKAEELELSGTHFENPTGLHDDNHYTTAHDMAIITQEALKDDFFRTVFTTRSYTTETSDHYMASSILKYYWNSGVSISHIVGCKTGYTSEAKSCLTALVQSQDQDIVCVFAKEEDTGSYVADAKQVINYCDSHYSLETVYEAGTTLDSITISGGVEKTYDISIDEDITLFISEDDSSSNYSIVYDGVESVKAPTVVDDKLGYVKVIYNEQTLLSYKVVMEEEIEATTLTKIKYFLTSLPFLITLGVLLSIYILAHFIRWCIRMNRRKKRHKNNRTSS